MINTSLFTAQSGDYAPIINTITKDDAIAFASIYATLETHAQSSRKVEFSFENGIEVPVASEGFCTITDYLNKKVAVSFEPEIASGALPIAAIATLKALGIIATSDDVHIALTTLGYGFYQSIKVEL